MNLSRFVRLVFYGDLFEGEREVVQHHFMNEFHHNNAAYPGVYCWSIAS